MERHGRRVLQLLVAVAAMAVGGGIAIAQEAKACPGTKAGECIEFLVRYHAVKKSGYGEHKVELLDPETRKAITLCELDKGCKSKPVGNQLDSTAIVLTQFRSNPHLCYRKCIGSWCVTTCPAH